MPPQFPAATPQQGLRGVLKRIPVFLLGTSALISVLGAMQWIALRYTNPRGDAGATARKVNVIDFSLSKDGRYGVSRALIEPLGARGLPLHFALYQHDLRDPQVKAALETDSLVAIQSAISPSGQQVVISTWDGKLALIDLAGPQRSVEVLGCVKPDWVSRLHWTPDGTKVIAAGDELVFAWSVEQRRTLYRWPHNSTTPPCLAITADSQVFLSATDEGLQVRNVADGELLRTVAAPHPIRSLTLASDGRFFVCNITEGLIAIDLHDGHEMWRRLPLPTTKIPTALSSDDQLIAQVIREFENANRTVNRVYVLEANTGRVLARLEPDVGEVTGMAFAPDRTLHIWGDQGVLSAWNVASSSQVWRHSFSMPSGE